MAFQEYDEYGNLRIRNFSRFILQAISDNVNHALQNLSSQIEDYVMRPTENAREVSRQEVSRQEVSRQEVSRHNQRDSRHSEQMEYNYYISNSSYGFKPNHAEVSLYKNLKNKEDKSCPICFEEYKDSCVILKTKCQHLFHEECINKWKSINHSSPICRKNI